MGYIYVNGSTFLILLLNWVLGSKPVSFPMEQNHQLARSTSPPLENVEQYRRLVGRLIYLSFTRLDLAYSVHILSQFLSTPRRDHWDATIHVF